MTLSLPQQDSFLRVDSELSSTGKGAKEVNGILASEFSGFISIFRESDDSIDPVSPWPS